MSLLEERVAKKGGDQVIKDLATWFKLEESQPQLDPSKSIIPEISGRAN